MQTHKIHCILGQSLVNLLQNEKHHQATARFNQNELPYSSQPSFKAAFKSMQNN
jgi:hypothetical protein